MNRTRRIILALHLYLGLVSGIFLVILGLTGSVMAFEGQIDHWLHPSRWYVTPHPQTLPESTLLHLVEQRFAPDRVVFFTIAPESNIAQAIFIMPPRGQGPGGPHTEREITIDQYSGSVLSVVTTPTTTTSVLAFIHQFHLRLGSGQTGKLIISVVGLILVFEVPLGVVLWWRTKRAAVKWKGSGFRVSFDLHHIIGVYLAAFLFLAAVTGIFIGFDSMESMFYRVTHSAHIPMRPAQSTVIAGAMPAGIDEVLDAAHTAMPDGLISVVQLPATPRGAYQVIFRKPGDAYSAVHATAWIDQYSGQVLSFADLYASPGYRAIRLNRALHTGDIFGLPSQIIVSLTSLALVVMVVTGVIIWWKKLAV